MVNEHTEYWIFKIGGWFVNLLLLAFLALFCGLIVVMYQFMVVAGQYGEAEQLVPLLQTASSNVLDASTNHTVEKKLLVEELKGPEYAELGEYLSWFPENSDVVYWVRVNDHYTIGIGRDGTIDWRGER